MKFLMVLFCVVVEMVRPADEYRSFEWFGRVEGWLHSRCGRFGWWHGPIGIIVTLLPGLIVVGLLFAVFGEGSILGSVFALLLVLYSLGPKDLSTQIDAFQAAISIHDLPSAEVAARAIAGVADSGEKPPTLEELQRAILVESNDRLFAVLFWFVVLGPFGALLFRLASELRRSRINRGDGFSASASDLSAILSWIPARLWALGYAMSGSLVHAMEEWQFFDTLGLHDNDMVLERCGRGAINRYRAQVVPDAEVALETVIDTRSLVGRTLVFWLVIFAIITLAG